MTGLFFRTGKTQFQGKISEFDSQVDRLVMLAIWRRCGAPDDPHMDRIDFSRMAHRAGTARASERLRRLIDIRIKISGSRLGIDHRVRRTLLSVHWRLRGWLRPRPKLDDAQNSSLREGGGAT